MGNIGGGFQVVGVGVLRVSGESRVLFGVSNRHSLERVGVSRLGKVFSLGIDVFVSDLSNGSGGVGFSIGSFGSLLDFDFFESHGGEVFVFTVAAFGVFFGFFEHEHAGEGKSIGIAFAAFELGSASGVFTNKLTFGFGAFGLVAFPVTSGFFANGFTFRFRHLTMSNTVGGFTDSHTFRAIFHFTGLIRTHDLTVRSFTFDITNGVFRFLARRVAFGGFANWGTDGITSGIVAFP